MHVADDGIQRWALYRCGHVHSQVVIVDEPHPQPIGS